tara:strand:- start:10555 stop:10776 length:222 start_codon:yes stop_codon:yes gene_type:complete
MRRQERRLRNIAQNKTAILDKPPALNQMLDGQQVYARASGNNLRLYIRIGAKLYYTEFLPVEKQLANNWEDLD